MHAHEEIVGTGLISRGKPIRTGACARACSAVRLSAAPSAALV